MRTQGAQLFIRICVRSEILTGSAKNTAVLGNSKPRSLLVTDVSE